GRPELALSTSTTHTLRRPSALKILLREQRVRPQRAFQPGVHHLPETGGRQSGPGLADREIGLLQNPALRQVARRYQALLEDRAHGSELARHRLLVDRMRERLFDEANPLDELRQLGGRDRGWDIG